MQLHVNESARLVEIWLDKRERQDAALRDELAPVLKEYRAQKYLPVFFLSGDTDLRACTAELLRSCRRRMGDPAG